MGQHLPANLELLGDHGGDAFGIGRIDDRAFLGAIDAKLPGPRQQRVKLGHRFHQLDAIGLVLKALVDLDEGNHALGGQRRRGRFAVNLAVHRPLEQDRADDLFAGEGGRRDDPGTHLVDEPEHLFFAAPRVRLYAIALERLGGRSARLVKRGDETLSRCHLFAHCLDVHCHSPVVPCYWRVAPPDPVAGCPCTGSPELSLNRKRRDAGQLLAFHPFEESAAGG